MRTIISEQEASLRFPMPQPQTKSERTSQLRECENNLSNLEQENRNIAAR